MGFFALALNALVAGVLLGGFYAIVSLGISIAFGMLDIANLAHPGFVVLGSYLAYMLNTTVGLDPLVVGLALTPVFYVLGMAVYRIYYMGFERRGEESLRGLVFFFGLLFIVEVGLLLAYGVDYRAVDAWYIGGSIRVGQIGIALRLLIPCLVAFMATGVLHVVLRRTFWGRAVMAVSQDSLALRLVGADPVRVKAIAFGVSIATASLAGALLIMIGPVQPAVGADYLGRIFAVAVLGGMGSVRGTLVAALILGVAESLTSFFYGPSWALAVSFGILLLVLAVRPTGLFAR